MNATELSIDVVYNEPYWVVQFEKIFNNRKLFARKRLGKKEPSPDDLTKFFESLNYKSLRYIVA